MTLDRRTEKLVQVRLDAKRIPLATQSKRAPILYFAPSISSGFYSPLIPASGSTRWKDRPQTDQDNEQFEKFLQGTVIHKLVDGPKTNGADDHEDQNGDQDRKQDTLRDGAVMTPRSASGGNPARSRAVGTIVSLRGEITHATVEERPALAACEPLVGGLLPAVGPFDLLFSPFQLRGVPLLG